MSIVQLTPTYPPDVSGVGDYAAILADRFSQEAALMGTLVAGVTSGEPSEGVERLERREAAALAAALGDTQKLLLHFSGYGYARRGLCRWLVDGLARWKGAGPERRLVTMFHEVYATGPVWRSSFWTASAQRSIACGLAELSDAGFVSSQGGYDSLHPLCRSLPLEVLEVFSNVGEVEMRQVFADRAPRAVVFGGSSRRLQVYRALGKAEVSAAEALQQAGVSEIHDIGPACEAPTHIAGCNVRSHGPLPAKEVSDLLAQARIGLVNYRHDKITKSGIAAAYFAHGTLVVNCDQAGRYPANLVEGHHLAGLDTLGKAIPDAERIAAAGWARYRPHGLVPTAQKLLGALDPAAVPTESVSGHG